MKLSKLSLLFSLGLLLSVFTVACSGEESGGEDATETTADKEGTEEVEQVLNLTNGDQIPTMDVSMATDQYAFRFLGMTTEGLYRLDENAEPTEGIAVDHEVSDDGLTWTFNLREDAEWENGDPVTAHDFVYAWRRAVDPDTGSEYGPFMMNGVIKNAEEVNSGEMDVEELGVKAEDDHTLVVELAKPIPYFESLTTFGTFYPLNEEFVEEKGDDYATNSDNLLANGPFKMEDWDSTADSWTLVKNDNYWDADTVKIEKINYDVVKDPQVDVDLYEKGEIDRAGLSADNVDKYISHEDFVATPSSSVFYIKMNQTRNEALANVNIRKAISRAFDKEALVDTILNNGSLAANGLIPREFSVHPESGEDFRDLNGDLVEFDADEAQEYWEKGLDELGTDSVELEFLADDGETAKEMNEYLKNQLETNLPGLTVNLKQIPFEQRLDLDTNMDYDLQLSGWGPDYQDPYTFLGLWVTDGENNKMGFSSDEYDELLEKTTDELATEPEKRYEALLEAEKVLFEEAAIAPVFQKSVAQLISPRMEGVFMNPFGPDYEYKWAEVVPND